MDRSSILRASTNSYRQVEKCFYLPFLLLTDTAENRTLCRARALSKREAFVASGRGRRQAAEAGAGSRSERADSPRNAPAQYRCDADRASCPGLAPSTDPPYRGESNSVQGAGVSKRYGNAGWTRFPNGGPGGNRIPESSFGMGYIFRMGCWRKAHPGIPSQIGTRFPLHLLNSKTYAPSIPKLGRRKPKRNRRRSI